MSQLTTPKERTEIRDATEAKRPPLYKVLLLNDNYTTTEFVVMVLEQVFNKNHVNAERIMLSVHQKGTGVAGVYVKDIAEMKCDAVQRLAQTQGFPLCCDMEPE
ncbi:MAG: ATP-dependent Clp protease adaptor ClpS [Candidatus Hydrogenedentes bacterium]|nr:ATP-dependent Clp protease adaptor ClpS [Candidatus Hydrogenedentota bacterium]